MFHLLTARIVGYSGTGRNGVGEVELEVHDDERDRPAVISSKPTSALPPQRELCPVA